ncbi:MAG: hypothetical protein KatS3mg102_1175 [Planctomycetota bacterium]|nr:MAG: hypothetical protein KatS3mg102_1175 [Planctomycetota bacterium]
MGEHDEPAGGGAPRGICPRARAAARLGWLALLAVLALPPAAAAPRARAGPPEIYLDVLDGDLAAELLAADEDARACRWQRAAERYQRLLELALGAERERVVPRAPGGAGGALAALDGVPRPGVLYEGLARALRRRLAALPPAGLQAYRQRYEPEAHAALARARAEPPAAQQLALAELARRFTLTPSGHAAAVLLGDWLLERGEWASAASCYELAALAVPAHEQQPLARRLAWLGRPSRCSPPLPAVRPPALALSEGEAAGAAAALTLQPIPLPDGLAVPRPGRVVLTLAGAAAGRGIRVLPAGASPPPEPSPGPLRLGGCADGRVLAVALEHPRLVSGAGFGPPPGDPLATAYDLFVFDLGRQGALVGTTAEPEAFGAEAAAWLRGVEWPSPPLLAPGALFAAAVRRTSEPELHLAAFRRAPLSLAWRTFVCARRYTRSFDDGAPLQAALARTGATVVLTTALGVAGALDALSGEVRWLLWHAAPAGAAAGAGVPIDLEEPREPSPPWPPLVAADQPEAVLLSTRTDGTVRMRRAADGALLWQVASERFCRAVALLGPWALCADDRSLFLVERRTGKRAGLPLWLPAHARVRGVGASIGEVALVPLGTELPLVRAPAAGGDAGSRVDAFCLAVRARGGARGAELQPLGARALPAMGSFDVVALPGGGAAVAGEQAFVWPAGLVGSGWGSEGLQGLALLYGAGSEGLQPAAALAALRELGGAEPPGEIGGYRIEVVPAPGGGWSAWARPLSPPARPYLVLERATDGTVRARVAGARYD